MTLHLYDRDAYMRSFEATVISCEAAVLNKKDVYAVVLDRTAFFPEQGGQDCDTGTLTNRSDQTAHVIYAGIGDDIVTHYCDRPFKAGDRVKGEIDWEARYDRMQQHSGEHLVSGFVHTRFGFDNVGFHLGDTEVTLDFNGTFSGDEISLIEDEVNRRIYADVPSVITFPSPEELKTIPYRSKKELTGAVRIVEFPGFDICACCAPHVHTTGEIGQIKIIKAEHFKGGTRITIMCGMRALHYHRARLDDCTDISRQLSSLVTATPEAVIKLRSSADRLHVRVNTLETRLLSILSEEAVCSGSHTIVIDEANPDIVREALNRMVSQCSGFCAAYIGSDDKGYRFMVAASDRDCRELIPQIRDLGGKGGGSDRMIQGTSPVIIPLG